MVIIDHVCSIHSLFSIVEGGVFRPTYANPLAADAGLNCYIRGKEYSFRNAYLGSGCILSFEWIGPVSYRGVDVPTPYPKDELLNQKGWRAIVPINSDPKLLKFHSYKINDTSWIEVTANPKWLTSIPHLGDLIKRKRRSALEILLNQCIGKEVTVRY